jgi:regulator of protease activity HflC (stomatin/prohibitin superfamily)
MLFIVIAAILIGLLLFKSIVIVPQGFSYTIERFGRYLETLTPGINFIIPVIDSIGVKVNVMENVLDVPSQDVITRDNALVTVDGVVFYAIFDPSKSAYGVTNLKMAVLNLTMTNIRTVMGAMDLDELLSNREVISERLLHVVDEATTPWGTKVTRIQIKDIKPPKNLVDSMARQMMAEREKRALILEAEGERQSAILKAEGERQSAILQAEGSKISLILGAEARLESAVCDAKARECLCLAEANGISSISLASQNHNTLNYLVAQKYIEAFSKLASSSNEKIIMMPMEVSGIMSSLSGISELLTSKTKNTIQATEL